MNDMSNRILRIAASAGALIIGLELGTRLDEFVRWGTPIQSTANSVSSIIQIDSLGARGRPGMQYRQFAINSLGLRGPEPVAGRPRVLVLGASETFGLHEAAGKEYPRQLEDSLLARGCSVSVLNGGLPGFSLPTQTISYARHFRRLGASLVVIYPTPVQYLEDDRPSFIEPSGATRPAAQFSPRSLRRIRDHLKLVLPEWMQTAIRSRQIVAQRRESGTSEQWTSVPADRLQAYESDLGSMIDAIRSTGAEALVLTHANAFGSNAPEDFDRLIQWAKFYPRAAPPVLPAFDVAANRQVPAIASQHGAIVSDVAAQLNVAEPERFFADFAHFTELGSAVVAGVAAADIVQRIGCPKAPR